MKSIWLKKIPYSNNPLKAFTQTKLESAVNRKRISEMFKKVQDVQPDEMIVKQDDIRRVQLSLHRSNNFPISISLLRQ